MTHRYSLSRLTKNTVWNILGTGIPLLVALFAIPVLVRGMGTERFGILMLTLAVIGYFSLFDLGLGRALTKLVAEKLGRKQDDEVPGMTWTAMILQLFLGCVSGLLLFTLAPWLVANAMNIPHGLQDEALVSLRLLGCSLPFITTAAGLRAVLEAYQHFDALNWMRIPMGVFTYLAPLVVLLFSKSLVPVMGVLVIGRVLAWLAHLVVCLRWVPGLKTNIAWQRGAVRPLATFGGWITVSSIVGPILFYADRFVVAGFLSMTVVAYYATPLEVVLKLLLIPATILGVMFPAFSHAFAHDMRQAAHLYTRSVSWVILLVVPLVLAILFFAEQGLAFWLNEEFARNGSGVARILAVGVLLNSVGLVAQSFIQAAGHPDWSAKLHLAELSAYLIYLPWLVQEYGANGAALAWTLRVTISAVTLIYLSRRVLGVVRFASHIQTDRRS